MRTPETVRILSALAKTATCRNENLLRGSAQSRPACRKGARTGRQDTRMIHHSCRRPQAPRACRIVVSAFRSISIGRCWRRLYDLRTTRTLEFAGPATKRCAAVGGCIPTAGPQHITAPEPRASTASGPPRRPPQSSEGCGRGRASRSNTTLLKSWSKHDACRRS
jgi:hypothetical protein